MIFPPLSPFLSLSLYLSITICSQCNYSEHVFTLITIILKFTEVKCAIGEDWSKGWIVNIHGAWWIKESCSNRRGRLITFPEALRFKHGGYFLHHVVWRSFVLANRFDGTVKRAGHNLLLLHTTPAWYQIITTRTRVSLYDTSWQFNRAWQIDWQ